MSRVHVTVISLPKNGDGGFDPEALDAFCRDHDVIGWKGHF